MVSQNVQSPNSRSPVLACSNGAPWQRDLRNGLSRQTMQPSALINCDDATTDATWATLTETSTYRVWLSHHARNTGVVPTSAELLMHVNIERFSVCDPNAVWWLDKLEKSVRLLESSGVSLVYTGLTAVDENIDELASLMSRRA